MHRCLAAPIGLNHWQSSARGPGRLAFGRLGGPGALGRHEDGRDTWGAAAVVTLPS